MRERDVILSGFSSAMPLGHKWILHVFIKALGKKCKCKNVKHEDIINRYRSNNTAASSNYRAKHINDMHIMGWLYVYGHST